jgi:hypothetical protein
MTTEEQIELEFYKKTLREEENELRKANGWVTFWMFLCLILGLGVFLLGLNYLQTIL